MATDKYNPNAPQIIGNEFLGIRDEDLVFDPLANTFERGYTYTATSSMTVTNIRAYLNTFPPKYFEEGCLTASIYPAGAEDQSGPVRSVIIPCNNGIVTGDSGGYPFSAVAFGGGATTTAEAVENPSGTMYINIRVGELYRSGVSFFFAVNDYAPLLYNKRILGIDFLTTLDMGSTSVNGGNDQGYSYIFMDNGAGLVLNNGNSSNGAVHYRTLVSPQTPSDTLEFIRIPLGDVSRFYGTTGMTDAAGTTNLSQWTFAELQRFQINHADRIAMRIVTPPIGIASGSTNFLVSYAALQVYFCEERRLGFGTRMFQDTFAGSPLHLGKTEIQVRTPGTSSIALSAGLYTVTLAESNMGESVDTIRLPMVDAKFNALRTKDEPFVAPVIPGVQVNLPYPLNETAIGTTITAETTNVVPQLTLHGSSGTQVESVVYGRQSVGQVYSASSPAYVQQNVYSALTQTTRTYDWLRIWARRFGDTTGALSVQVNVGPGTAIYNNYITVDDFDALDTEVIDGWKQVDFDFTATPVSIIPTALNTTITFTSQPTLAAGNRWEVLGCAAPAVSGIAGNSMNLVPTPNTLILATYGAPVSGALIRETWLPQLGPYVSGATPDSTADLTFLFSQTQPVVTGFAITTESQPVSGIGESCGGAPCCIPTGILYNEVTWGLPANTGQLLDEFDRTVSDGWGTATSGQAWSAPVGGAASQARVYDGFLSGSLYLPGAGVAATVTTPDTAALDITGDIDLRLDGTFVLPLANESGLVTKWNGTGASSFVFSLLPSGFLRLYWSADGTAALFAESTAAIPASTTRAALRATLDVDNGAAGRTITFYIAATSAGPWSPLGAAVVQPGVTSIFNSATSVEIGGWDVGTTARLAGIVHSAQILNGIAGTTVANPNFDLQAFGTTSFADSAGLTWTLAGAAQILKGIEVHHAQFTPDTGSAFRYMVQPDVAIDFDITATMTLDSVAIGQGSFGLVGRYTDASNNYEVRVSVQSTGTAALSLDKIVGGSFTLLRFVTLPFLGAERGYGPLKIRFMGYGPFLKAKVWSASDPEPTYWTAEAEDSSLTTGSGVGTVFLDQIGTGATYGVDDFIVAPPDAYFGYYELQRMDTVEPDWQTIMKCTDPGSLTFNDYEARIGIESSYRIRTTDLYEFPGPWSSTITNTIDAPGIEGGDCVLEGHILVFTSNENQDGAYNLAYASVWTNGAEVTEDFRFAEATFVQLQTMYDKNFFTAFRPSERGGDSFSRTVLVQAAAIAPETLADFRSLRDMAWDNVNYICVRDEDGNRWFATVLVPDGRVLRDRRLYLANVSITEVTDVPTPVNPAA